MARDPNRFASRRRISLARAIAVACVLLSGCGGTALLKESQPFNSSQPVAAGKDERVVALVENVILSNGPGAWARNAQWDEYLIRVRAVSDEPVEIRDIAIFDALENRLSPRAGRGDLVDGTADVERRYQESGKLVRTSGENYGWVVAGTGVAGGATVVALAAPAGFAGMATVAAAATVAVGAVAVLAGVGVVRLVNNAEVDNEIKRRSTSLPLVVQPGTEASLDLFFPLTPLSARTQVVYVDRKGEHRLDIDTRQMLEALDTIEMAPKVLSRIEPKFPHEARAAGARQGSVTALLTLDQQGHVQRVDVVRSEPAGVFDREARQTLQLWTYSKGRQDGRTAEVTLEFNR